MKDVSPMGQAWVQSGCVSPEVSMLHRATELQAPILQLSDVLPLSPSQTPNESVGESACTPPSLLSSGIFSQQDTQ